MTNWNGTGKSTLLANKNIFHGVLLLILCASCDDLTGNTYISFRSNFFEKVEVTVGNLALGEVKPNMTTPGEFIPAGSYTIVINTASGLVITQKLTVTSKKSRILVVLDNNGQITLEPL